MKIDEWSGEWLGGNDERTYPLRQVAEHHFSSSPGQR